MKPKSYIILVLLFLTAVPFFVTAQSCANYTVARSTGIAYTSIAANSPSYFTWRNLSVNQYDDNRSYQEPVGFDFWYLGVRYSQFSANLNGTIDFSSSTSDGNNGGAGPYGPNYGNPFTTANRSMLALAPMYDDLWTAASGTVPVATSIFYQTSGTTPNRVLTVEWENFDKWNSSTGSVNFQVKLYESTGKIEFVYGTMTAGSAAFVYACGINGNWSSGSPNATQLLTQQTANTTSFNSSPKDNLSTLPAAHSKISFTPPVPSGSPTGLSFTAISKTGMTLHWTDHANNEVGYAIYHSTDNINFIYAGETSANASSMVMTGLYPSTTYYWQVHSVTEGNLGTALTGIKATLPAGIISSVKSGNWNSTSTWDCHCIPTIGDDITIANGHTVTVDVNAVCNMLTVGQGTSGQLIIGNNSTARTLTVDSDIVVHPGGIITTGATAAIHTLIIDDDIINNGTFDLAPTTTRVCNVMFTNDDDSDQIVSGSGVITNFNSIAVNLGLSTNKVEITASNFTAASNFLTLTSGIFKLSTGATITPFTGNVTLPINTTIWLNHSGASLSTTGGSVTHMGTIRLTAGVFNIGNATDNNLLFDNGMLLIEEGAMNIAGRLDNLGVTALTNLTMTGGTLTVGTVGSTTSGKAVFHIDEVGSNFTISGGTIVLRKPGAGNLGYVNTGGTNGTVSGGVLQIGDAFTPAAQTFEINSSIVIPSLVVSNGVAVTALLITNSINVKNNILIGAGTLNCNSLNISLGGNWINNGTFTANGSTIDFSGTTAGNIGASNFNNITFSGSGIKTATGALAIAGNVRITNNFTTGFFTHTVSGDWTNSGSFTANTSTIDFNKAGAQNIGGSSTNTFYNITCSNSGIKSITSNANLIGTLTVSGTAVLDADGPSNNKIFTLKSDATNTATVAANTTGTIYITGNVTAERYIPATGRAYRLLSPTVTGSGSIRANWMEGANNSVNGVNIDPAPGYGIQITGSGGSTNGFDVTQTNQASLYLATNTGAEPTYTAVANTSGTLNPYTGYFVFIRGNRSQDMTLYNTNVPPLPMPLPTSSTTLRTTGTLLLGTQTGFTNATIGGAGNKSLITNPYASPIDWSLVYASCSHLSTSYTMWDPSIGYRGGFVSVQTNGTVSGGGTATKYIQPGQAFFVEASGALAPTISIEEMHKVAANNNNLVYGPQGAAKQTFSSLLYFTESSGHRRVADGVTVVYDDAFSAGLDADDAIENGNWDENIAIDREGKHLAIESRPLFASKDSIPLYMNNMKQMNYEFQFTGSDFVDPSIIAILVDKFTGIHTQLSTSSSTVVPFSVTAVTGSSASDRFMVIFSKPSGPLPIYISSVKAYEKNSSIQVDWIINTEQDMDRYEVEKSTDGRSFAKATTVLSKGNSLIQVNYGWVDANTIFGDNFYRIKSIDKGGYYIYSNIVHVNMGKRGSTDISIYPNPFEGNGFNLQMNNLEAGKYILTMYNYLGQRVYTGKVTHGGGSATQYIDLGKDLAGGTYTVKISGGATALTRTVTKK